MLLIPPDACNSLALSLEPLVTRYDHFVRTTEGKHSTLVKEVLKRVWDNGDIYKARQAALTATIAGFEVAAAAPQPPAAPTGCFCAMTVSLTTATAKFMLRCHTYAPAPCAVSQLWPLTLKP